HQRRLEERAQARLPGQETNQPVDRLGDLVPLAVPLPDLEERLGVTAGDGGLPHVMPPPRRSWRPIGSGSRAPASGPPRRRPACREAATLPPTRGRPPRGAAPRWPPRARARAPA